MMAERIGWGLFPAAAMLLAVDAALGQGMQTFTRGASCAAALPGRHRRMAQHIKCELSL